MLIRKENEQYKENLGRFQFIPVELLIHIAKYLPLKDFVNLCLTTSDLSSLLDEETIWQNHFMRYFPNTHYNELFLQKSFKENFQKKFTVLKRIFKGSRLITLLPFIEGLTNEEKNLAKKQIKKVINEKVISHAGFSSLLAFCRNYQHQTLLDIIFYHIQDLENTKQLDEKNLLHMAILCNQIEWINDYTEKNSHKINKPVLNKYTLLHLACLANNKEIITVLLDGGADLNTTVGFRKKNIKYLFLNELFYSGDELFNCFLLAIKHNNVELLKFLVEKDKQQVFKPNILYPSELKSYPFAHEPLSALHIAAFFNASKCTEFLIDQGHSVDQISGSLWRPLHLAVLKNSKETVKTLLEKNANQRVVTRTIYIFQGFTSYPVRPTPFFLAFIEEKINYEIVYLLLDDINYSRDINSNLYEFLTKFFHGPLAMQNFYIKDRLAKSYHYFLKGMEELIEYHNQFKTTLSCNSALNNFKASVATNKQLFGHCLARLILNRYKIRTNEEHQYILTYLVNHYKLVLIKFISNFDELYLDLTNDDRKKLEDFMIAVKKQFDQPKNKDESKPIRAVLFSSKDKRDKGKEKVIDGENNTEGYTSTSFSDSQISAVSSSLTSSSSTAEVGYPSCSRNGLFVQQMASDNLLSNNRGILINIVNLINEFSYLNVNKKIKNNIYKNLDSIKLIIIKILNSNGSITDEIFHEIADFIKSKLNEIKDMKPENQFFSANLWSKKWDDLNKKIIKKIEMLDSNLNKKA